MRFVVRSTPNEAARFAAREIARAFAALPSSSVALPTGSTMMPVYRALVRLHQAGRADFGRARTFNLDEFAGIASADPRSFHAFMRRHLFDHVNLRRRHTHVLNGVARDWRREITRFEAAIAAAGGFDLAVLGLGRNGHIAFNEPASALVARTHRARLTRATRVANAEPFGGRWRAVPAFALTMGVGTILGARRVLLIATGAGKAHALRRACEGPITTRVPASLLQAHPDVTIVCDDAAASALRERN